MKLILKGTELEFSILPLCVEFDGYWANIRLAVKNDNIDLERTGAYLTRDEVKRLISAIELLLEGKIREKYSLNPIEPGLEIDLIPNVEWALMSKEQRKEAECKIELEIFTREEKTHDWSETSVVVRLSRQEIEKLLAGLKQEYEAVFGEMKETNIAPRFLVRGETGDFCLSIVDYQYHSPKAKIDRDDDWLEIMVEFTTGGQKYTYSDPSLLTNELERAILEMESLLLVEKGEYRSDFIEPYFVLNAFKNANKFEVEVKFFNAPETDGYNWENTETYAREACDKTEYVKKIVSLKAMLEMFPKRDGRQKKKPFIDAGTCYGEDGEYLYVGVSPKGCYGYNYWYIDEEKQTRADTYVWVNMGRRNVEQIVYVDSVRYCNADGVPYPIEKTKRILRQATEEEAEEADVFWER